MKPTKRWTALFLCILLILSCGTQALAAESGGTPYSSAAVLTDKVLGKLHDGLFRLAQNYLRTRYRRDPVPTLSEYEAAEHPYLYPGTDGTVRGNGWSGAFASGSIIPVQWRRNAKGKPDPNGYCLDKARGTGGYPFVLGKIYTDQLLNVFLLSNGSDANGNGIDDLLIFISVDGVGVAYGTLKKIRAAVEQALAPYGVEKADILLCNVSATHCHVALDTQGMAFRQLEMFRNGAKSGRSLDPEMEDTIVSRAASCAKDAYADMENGELTYFETAPVDGASDKLESGVRTQNRFACFMFTGKSGKKTVLSNIAAHPTRYYNGHALYADYPNLMQTAMRDAGVNFLFVQSAQANINSPGPTEKMRETYGEAADAWAKTHMLTREDWINRYGRLFTQAHYTEPEKHEQINEQMIQGQMQNAYMFAHLILDASQSAEPVTPTLEVRTAQTLLKLEYGVMALACVSGLLGEETVCVPDAEAGYGVMVETNYIAVGDDIVILTAPGELSPSLAYGTDPEYTGDALWTGKTSWTGTDWPYDTLENLVRKATGDADKTVLIFGITNDALAYIYPDICCTQSLLGAKIFYKVNTDAMANSMLLTPGTKCGSQIMEGYMRVIGAESEVQYPCVLVHGLGGFGETGTVQDVASYWGVTTGSLPKYLREQGYTVCVPTVGPYSSTWDRTCELYAQLTGTRVDYGEAHAAKCGHARYGRTYTEPMVPDWGQEINGGQTVKIDLVSHSFGGETVRMLASLLAYGDEAERAASGSEVSPLFAGGKADWVHSVTTLCAPHNGSQLTCVVDDIGSVAGKQDTTELLAETLFKLVQGVDEKVGTPDIMLDQFGIGKNAAAETALQKVESIGSDHGFYDLSPDGAAELNKTIRTVDSVYYFSYAFSTTKDGTLLQGKVPEASTFAALIPLARALGSYTGKSKGGIVFDETWQDNDGLVSVVSAQYPAGERHADFPQGGAKLESGIWYVMPTQHGDHAYAVGMNADIGNIRAFFTQILSRAASLPR